MLNPVANIVADRLIEVGQATSDVLNANGMHQRYSDLYETVRKLLPPKKRKLLTELDALLVQIETFAQDRAYLAGLVDGIEIGGGRLATPID